MTKRIALDRCCGVIIDVQEFFLSQLAKPLRSTIETSTKNFAGLLGYLGRPIFFAKAIAPAAFSALVTFGLTRNGALAAMIAFAIAGMGSYALATRKP